MNVSLLVKQLMPKVILAFILSVFVNTFSFSQVLVAGTDFYPREVDATKTYYANDDVLNYGMQPVKLEIVPSFVPDIAGDALFDSFQYGIASNPSSLSSTYFINDDDDNYQLIFSPFTGAGNDRTVLKYNVAGLEPGSAVTFVIDYCSPVDLAAAQAISNTVGPGTELGFKVKYENATNSGGDKDVPKVKLGKCNQYTGTGVADGNGGFWVSIFAGYDDKDWHAVAISKIEIFGTPQPEISAAQGAEICNGEIITLQSKFIYEADYLWKVNDGSGWTDLGSNKAQLYEVQQLGDIDFQLELTLLDGSGDVVTSPIYTATSIACCDAGASRTTVYLDDFGRFDLDADPEGYTYYTWNYDDILDPFEEMHTSTERYRYPLPADREPQLHAYQDAGPPNDGWYTVAGHITEYLDGPNTTQHMFWANRISGNVAATNYDHSGTLEGAALFINCGVGTKGKVIYKREIDDLCSGNIFFEAWINVFTDGGNGVDVEVNVYDKDNPSVSQTFNATAEKGQGWQRLSTILPLQGSSLAFEMTNNSDISSGGNDLVIDDIKLMTCSAPAINLYFDLDELNTRVEGCRDNLDLKTAYSQVFEGFFAGGPMYQFQYNTRNPRDLTSWINIGTPVSKDNFTFEKFIDSPELAALNLQPGRRINFRVVVADATMHANRNNFQGVGNEANANDPCKNYSVSNYVTATIACPACKDPDFTGLELSAIADTMLCTSGTRTSTVLSHVGATTQDSIFYVYYYSGEDEIFDPSTDNIDNVPQSAATGVRTQDIDFSKPGWYSLQMYDGVSDDATACKVTHSIYIDTVTAPSYSLSADVTVCEGVTIADAEIILTGNAPFTYTLESSITPTGGVEATDSELLNSTTGTASITPPSTAGVATYSISTIADTYCTATIAGGDDVTYTINENPTVTFSDPTAVCTDAADVDVSTLVSPAPSTGTGVFSDTEGNLTVTGMYSPADVTAETDFTLTYSFTDANNCENSVDATITVNPIPLVDFTLETSYCQNVEIDLTAQVDQTPGTFSVTPSIASLATGSTFNTSDLVPWTDYTFSYLYADANGCDTTVSATTYSVAVPSIVDTASYSRSGIKPDEVTVTGDIEAKINNVGVLAGHTVQMNWIDPDGIPMSETDELLTRTHPSTVSNTFLYKAYQTIGTCVGDEITVPFVVSTCSATQPSPDKDFFCSGATTKSITLDNTSVFDYAWVDLSEGATAFTGKAYSDITIQGNTHSISETTPGTYSFYVAAYDVGEDCWSEPSQVDFVVVAEPVPTIKVPTDDVTACYTETTPVVIDLLPISGTDGVTGEFLVNSTTNAGSIIPANFVTNQTETLSLEYSVVKVISETGFIPERTCASLTPATATMTVEYVAAPTVTGQELPVDDFPYKPLTVAGSATAFGYNWYLDATLPKPAIQENAGDSFDASQNTPYNNDITITAYATEITADGCESEAGTADLKLVTCPHDAPSVVYEKVADTIAFDDCEQAVLDNGVSAIQIDNTVPSTYSPDVVYHWYVNDVEVVTGASYTPTDLSVGKHLVEVKAEDYSVAPATCYSSATPVYYEIFAMPEPSITVGDDHLCINDNAVSVEGFDGVNAVSSGVFSISPGAITEVGGSFMFNPASYGDGAYTISFTYEDENGCEAEASMTKTITVQEINKQEDKDFDELVSRLEILGGQQIYEFEVSPTDVNNTIEWYLDSTSSPRATGELYEFLITPQINTTLTPIREDYKVYFAEVDPVSGCKSKFSKATLRVTDCPVPAPSFAGNVNVCDNVEGVDIPVLEVTSAPKSAWPAGMAYDEGAEIRRVVGGIESVDSTYQHTSLTSMPNVEFYVYSDMHKCPSPPVNPTLTVHPVVEPRPMRDIHQAECFGMGSTIEFKVDNDPDYEYFWYDNPSSINNDIAQGYRHTVNSDDITGTATFYVSAKLKDEPKCQSDPADVSFTLEVYPEVLAPQVVSELGICASSMDINPISELPYYPSSSKVYTISAIKDQMTDEIEWYSDVNLTNRVSRSEVYSVPETDLGLPNEEINFYAIAIREGCAGTEYSVATIKPKFTPQRPKITSSSSVQGGTVCEGDILAEPPFYRAEPGDDLTDGNWEWYNFVDFDTDEVEKGNQPASSLLLHDDAELLLDPYVQTGGNQHFVVRQEIDGCYSSIEDIEFSVGKIPKLELNVPTNDIYYCQNKNTRGVEINVKDAEKEAGTNTTVKWEYSVGDPIEEDEYQSFVDNQAKYLWFPKRVGIDYLTVELTNDDGCSATDTIVLYVAPKEVPSFDYEYYNGDQEIVFYNNPKETMVYDQIVFNELHQNYPDKFKEDFAEPIDVKVELPTTYMWNFKYTEDGSNIVRPYPQMLQTYKDSTSLDYYVNKGPSNFYYNTKEEEEEGTKLIRVVEDKDSPVTYYDGNQVANRGGVYFEYGASEVWVVRNVTGFESCRAESETEHVFMEITTGLYLPSSLVPDHTSPLISVFKPYGHKLKTFKIWVFDNFGNTVWFSDQLDEKGRPTEVWDGRDKSGNLMPFDCYTWKVDAVFEDGKEWEGIPLENGKTSTIGTVCLLR